MKSLKLTITVCFLSSLLFNGLNAQLDVEYEWVETTGQFSGSSSEQVHDIAVDGNNNVYAIGNKGGAINYWNGNFVSSGHKGSSDIWITKFDENQNFLWNTNIGSSGIDDGNSIDVDADGNVYITGQFQRTTGGCEFGYKGFTDPNGTILNPSTGTNIGFVAKLNTNGVFQWIKTFEGGTCFPYSIPVDPNGYVYTTGRFTGTVDFDPGTGTNNLTNSGYSNDAFISKLDNDGNFVWARNFGGTGANDAIGRSIVADADHVYVKGYFKGIVDFKSSGDISSKNLTGSTSGFGDYFVIKVDNVGTSTKWAHHISRSEANAYTQGRSIALGSDGVYVTGEQGSQAFVAKLSNGNLSTSQTWLRNYGSNSQGQALTVDGSNNVFITGNFGGTVDFDPNSGTQSLSAAGTKDVFISCLDLNGNYVFAKQLGGSSSNNNGMGIQLGTNGEVFSGGWYSYTTDFDPGAGTENRTSESNSRDLYIHKMFEQTCTTPSAPTAANQSFCASENATISDLAVSGETGATFTWYNVSTGGTALPSGTALTNGTYYVSQTVDGCESPRTAVTVTINPGPSAPSTNATQVFCNSATVGDLIATGSDLQWYDVATGGSPLSSGTALTNGTYYVSQTVDGCESSRIPVTVEVTTDLTPTVSISGTPTSSICAGESVTFTATPTNGGSNPTYQWQINGVDVSGETGSTFTTTDLNDGDIVTVVMTSDHPCANPTSASADTDAVVVGDDEAPVFTDCPTDITVSSGNDCEAIVTWTSPTATDNCTTTPVITSSHNSGDIFPVGTTEVTYTAEDDAGNVTTCSFNVTVVDDEAPVFVSCVSDTAMFIEEACGVVLPDFTLAVDVADNCSSATAGTLTLTQNPAAGTSLGVGTHTVELLLEDAGGNTSTCSFEIVVSDTLAPVIEIEGLSATYCAGEEVVWTTNISDNCGVDTVTSTHDSGESFPVGTTTVTYTAVDASGNVSTYSFDVVVGALPSAADLGAADFSVCLGRDITLSIDNPEENTTYSWVFLGDEVGTGTSHTVTSSTLDDEGTYIVVSTSPEGCVSVTEVELSVNQCEIVISGGISPNGDGLNDVFEIGGIEAYPKTEV